MKRLRKHVNGFLYVWLDRGLFVDLGHVVVRLPILLTLIGAGVACDVLLESDIPSIVLFGVAVAYSIWRSEVDYPRLPLGVVLIFVLPAGAIIYWHFIDASPHFLLAPAVLFTVLLFLDCYRAWRQYRTSHEKWCEVCGWAMKLHDVRVAVDTPMGHGRAIREQVSAAKVLVCGKCGARTPYE